MEHYVKQLREQLLRLETEKRVMESELNKQRNLDSNFSHDFSRLKQAYQELDSKCAEQRLQLEGLA